MQDLRLVGVHDDGEHLVLSTPDGQKYLLVVDEALRAAIRLDRARLGRLQIETEGRLRPRDIQARIRSGQTAEEIAQAAGLPVEHVRRFEGPVLAEREFVVRQAQGVRVRTGQGVSATLGEVVSERLAARAVEESLQSWDAWRGDDGVWMVCLTFTAGSRQRQARWSYDAQLRHVSPRDDESRWLTDEDAEEPGSSRAPRLTTVSGGALRRDGEPGPTGGGEGSGRDRVYDVEADGGVRVASEPRPALNQATVDLLDSLRERRGRRQRSADPELAGGVVSNDPMDAALHGGPAGWSSARAEPAAEPPAAHPPASRPDLATDAEVLVLTDPDGGPTLVHEPAQAPGPAPAPGEGSGVAASAAAAKAPPAKAPPAKVVAPPVPAEAAPVERPPARRNRRASVPKWDDIVFGSRRE